MPYTFRFLIENHLHFSGSLHCEQCEGTTKNGQQCGRTTCIGTRWCYQHLLSEQHLRVQPSGIPHSGKGLFAQHPDKDAGNIILFRTGDRIIAYDGEIVTQETLNQRYQNHTAPYGIQISKTSNEDGALHRGVGTLVNHPPKQGRSNARFSISKHRIVLVATKNIRNHQEIFVNYGKSYRFNENTSYKTK